MLADVAPETTPTDTLLAVGLIGVVFLVLVAAAVVVVLMVRRRR